MVRTKVFVGNLSFNTRETELATEFGSVAKVLSANIITRGPRSLGYGFVELESEEDAKKAVAAMDKKEIDGRPINCEVAKVRAEGEERTPQEGGAEGAQRSPSTRGRGRGGARGGRGRGGAAAGGSPAPAGSAEHQEGPRPPRTRRPRAAASAAGSEGENKPEGGAAPRGGRGGRRGGAAPRPPRPEGEAATGSPSSTPKARAAPRPKRDPNAPDTRVPSKTSLFVANLPFSLTDEAFGALFSEAGLKFKKAHVVTKRNQKSKGFGFVEFETQEDQQKALTTLQGKKVENRELGLNVALEDPNKSESVEKTPQSPAPATETKTN